MKTTTSYKITAADLKIEGFNPGTATRPTWKGRNGHWVNRANSGQLVLTTPRGGSYSVHLDEAGQVYKQTTREISLAGKLLIEDVQEYLSAERANNDAK